MAIPRASQPQPRVLIASLFLPSTIALHAENVNPVQRPPPSVAQKPIRPKIRSIVDDISLRSGLQVTPITPNNPFSTFSALGVPVSPIDNSLDESPLREHCLSRESKLLSNPESTQKDHVDFHVVPNPQSNVGLFNAVNSVDHTFSRGKVWIGVLGQKTNAFSEHLRNEIAKTMREEYDSIPVWTDDESFTRAYDIFCHQVLWPTLHSAVPDAPKSNFFSKPDAFAEYAKLNEMFADAIVAAYQPGDVIWVHDYHLMLVPKLVKSLLPNAIVGFFLHVAFPSSEIFRCLAVREKLLRGVLGADLVGFQTHNYTRHFRQTVSRLLSLEAVPQGIQLEHSFVDVAVFPIGIDVVTLERKRKDPEVLEWVQTLRQRYGDMKMIVGRDNLDEIHGVRLKVLAFEAFLEENPDFQGKVVLVQVALDTAGQNDLQIQGGVTDVVSRINARFSSLTYQPIVFLHTHELTFPQYLALLTVADAFLVTSLREGMALRTHEFVECQEARKRPLILSEFTGSYSYSGFRSCIPINPWDTRMTANAIRQSLLMSDQEASTRWKELHNHVVTQTAQAFVTSFLTRSLHSHIEHDQREAAAIPSLDMQHLLLRYQGCKRRLLLIDLERTLYLVKPKTSRTQKFELPSRAVNILRKLAADPQNEVWVLSGLPVRGQLDNIAAAIPTIGLCAENGCFLKPTTSKPREWVSMVLPANLKWKSPCLEILRYFTERTPGSFIEEREASIVWRFWTGTSNDPAEKHWARRQAAEAQNHIWDSLGERFNLRIIPGTQSFLVLPKQISRMTAIETIFRGSPLKNSQDPLHGVPNHDFILAIGSDEPLISHINEIPGAETCSTSMKRSNAKWRLAQANVVDSLEMLCHNTRGVMLTECYA